MILVAPDILDEVRQLAWYLPACGLMLGLLMWLFGGRGHRFWLVLALTLAGGVFGLTFGAAYGVQPLVAGLLLGVAAGTLALALARVALFLVVGAGCVWLAHTVAPAWDEPAVCFLVGGLLGVLLYKVWVTALSSLAGTLLIAYSILGLMNRFGILDAVSWAGRQAAVLNWACGAFAVLGLLAQLLMERRRRRRRREKEKAEKEDDETAPEYPSPWPPHPPAPKHWWERGGRKGGRHAA